MDHLLIVPWTSVCVKVHTHERCISAAIIASVIAVVAAAATTVVLVVVVAGVVGLVEAVVVVVVVVVVGVVYSNSSNSSSKINSINPSSGGRNIRRSPFARGLPLHFCLVHGTDGCEIHDVCLLCVDSNAALPSKSMRPRAQPQVCPCEVPANWPWPGVPGGTVPSLTTPFD
jgi:hypothetical protein